MKIAFVCRCATTQRPGGMLFVVEDRARELVKLGHEVVLFTTGHNVQKSAICNQDGSSYEVVHLPCPPMVYSRQFAEECKKAVAAFAPDILHLDSLDRDNVWWPELRQQFPKMQVTCTLHGFGYGSHLTAWNLYKLGVKDHVDYKPEHLKQEMLALRTFDFVISTSLCEEWYLLDTYSLPHVKLVYNPIYEGYFTKPLDTRTFDRPRFLVASITGQGTRMFHKAKEVAEFAGVEIVEASHRTRAEMVDLVDSCTATIVPTCYAQGYDLVVPEALARGRGVIASATGSYLREAQAGLPITTFPTGDWTRLKHLLNEPRFVQVRNPSTAGGRHRPSVHANNWLFEHGVV